jgi:hypothetical protein
MSIKNINQDVDTNRYGRNFDSIFGKNASDVPKTGTYIWDPVGKCLVKLDTTTPSVVRRTIDPLMPAVRAMTPIPVSPKQVSEG